MQQHAALRRQSPRACFYSQRTPPSIVNRKKHAYNYTELLQYTHIHSQHARRAVHIEEIKHWWGHICILSCIRKTKFIGCINFPRGKSNLDAIDREMLFCAENAIFNTVCIQCRTACDIYLYVTFPVTLCQNI
jgi:hypothetical protein